MINKYPEIIKYPTPTSGKVPFYDVPEYNTLFVKYYGDPDKQYMLFHEISEIFEKLYLVRTEAHKHNVENLISSILKLSKECDLNLENDFGLSWQEGTYLLYLGYEAEKALYIQVREALLSRGLLVFNDEYINYLLHSVESRIEYYDGRINAMLNDLFNNED